MLKTEIIIVCFAVNGDIILTTDNTCLLDMRTKREVCELWTGIFVSFCSSLMLVDHDFVEITTMGH